jgi:DHA1 family inner membrane transport protein
MSAPGRVVAALRPAVKPGILVATAVSTVVFAATPFLIPAVADDQAVSIGMAGFISTAQLSGFVVASWVGGRSLTVSRHLFAATVMASVLANLASGLAPSFWFLVGARVLSGVSLGLIAWMAWAEVFGDADRMGDIAIIGPVVGTLVSPPIAVFVDRAGPDWLYLALAAVAATPLLFVGSMGHPAHQRPQHRKRHAPTRAAAVILGCLGLLTLGGSAVFVFAASIGKDLVGLSPLAVSLAFSVNAIAGVPSARYRGSRRGAGFWMASTAVAAFALCVVHSSPVFWLAMAWWGFAFWMGVPGAFRLLAERSRFPEERAGDAQSTMALGRVFGPLVGGVVYDASPRALGMAVGGVMLAAAGVLVWVERRVPPYVPG